MSIRYIEDGNAFDTGLQWIVHPVNVPEEERGALEEAFKKRFPSDEVSKYYQQLTWNTQYKVGNIGVWTDDYSEMYIVFFPIKELWEDKPTLLDIEVGLSRFRNFIKEWDITQVAFPKLGENIPLIDWDREVKPLFEKYLGDLDIDIEVYV